MNPRAVFEALVALPREAGTPGAEEARSLIAGVLVSRGYTVETQRFSFQPAALNAFPLLGAGLIWLVLIELPLLMLPGPPRALPPLVWLIGLAALGALAWGVGAGVAVPGAERRDDANLIVTPGTGPVRRWIVAHVDTKAQGHSMAGRLVALAVLVVAVAGFTVLVALRAVRGSVPANALPAAAGLAVAAGVLLGRGRLRGSSPGARDNGTGLLAALIAAEQGPRPGTGFLFTGAEEFGLVGARIAAASGVIAGGAEVINLDTLGDAGALSLIFHDPPGRALAGRLAGPCAGLGLRVAVRRLPPGILVDSLPFARAGARAVTLGRVDWATLRRLHTPRDDADGLDLATAEAVGRLLSALGGPD